MAHLGTSRTAGRAGAAPLAATRHRRSDRARTRGSRDWRIRQATWAFTAVAPDPPIRIWVDSPAGLPRPHPSRLGSHAMLGLRPEVRAALQELIARDILE